MAEKCVTITKDTSSTQPQHQQQNEIFTSSNNIRESSSSTSTKTEKTTIDHHSNKPYDRRNSSSSSSSSTTTSRSLNKRNNASSSSSSSGGSKSNVCTTIDTLPGSITPTGCKIKECENVDDDTENDADDDNNDDNNETKQSQVLDCDEKVDIYLETPVADDDNNHELLLTKNATASSTTATSATINTVSSNAISLMFVKPKRLSDEFFSADDGESDTDEANVNATSKNKILPPSLALNVLDVEPVCIAENLSRFTNENSIDTDENLIVESSAYINDEELSSCSNLIDILQEHDESSPHSSTSPIIIGLQDDEDEVANHGDENGFFTSDVQSIDAIERIDIEQEQKLTAGGIVLRCSSSLGIADNGNCVDRDNRLKLGLINSFSVNQSIAAIATSSTTDDGSSASQSEDSSDQQLLNTTTTSNEATSSIVTNSTTTTPITTSTTPTSTKAKTMGRFVLNKSTVKINLSESLERLSATGDVDDILNNDTNSVNNISCKKLDNQSTLGESSSSSSSVAASSSTLSGAAAKLVVAPTKFDAFINCNSNDSSSSLKSFDTMRFSRNLGHISTKPSTSSNASVSAKLRDNAEDDVDDEDDDDDDRDDGDDDGNEDDDENSSSLAIASTSKVPGPSNSNSNSSSNCQYSKHKASTNHGGECSNDGVGDDDDDDDDEDEDDSCRVKCSVKQDDLIVEDEIEIVAGGSGESSKGLPSSSGHKSSNQNRTNENLDENNYDQSHVLRALENDHDYEEDTWADCEEISDGDEVCTCIDYSDEDAHGSSEDELPSRDVDLSGYTHLDTISEDILHESGSESGTPRNYHRKRKITESKSHYIDGTSSCSNMNDTPGRRKRSKIDGILNSPKQNPTTPTTPSLIHGLAIEKRTPRSIIPTRDNPPPELNDWLVQFQRWSHAERLLAIDQIIEHCEPTQVRHMMKVIEPQFQRDFISLLPKELALQVLSFLDPKDLLRAAQTCRSWRFLCDDNLLWKDKCRQSSILLEPKTSKPKRGRAGNMPPISSLWKAAYMRQHIIEMNWRSRPIREPKILKGHDDHVITCLQFCGNRIVSGSDDNTLKVWSAITGKCLRTLVGHTGGVWSSQMAGNIIISGSTDRTLKVWSADTGNCTHTLYGHTSTVRCMHLHGNKVVSGSRDATLRVWDIIQGKCLHILVGHLAAVRCVQYDGKLVVSGAYDYMVKVWNPERQECLHTLQGHTNRVYSLQFDGVHVVSGSLDTSIRVWDAETGSCKHTLMGHQSLTSGMELRQNILVSGNADSTVKVWDITNGQCLQTLSGLSKHQSAVTCLQFNSRFVITSSDDGTVKLWDVQTGDFIRNLVALDSGGSGGVVWRIRANDTKLICAVGSRNGTEETKLMVLDFDVEGACLKCS